MTVSYQVASVTVLSCRREHKFLISDLEMISEEMLVKFLDLNPFSIPKLCRQHESPVFVKLALVVWQTIALYTSITVLFEMNIFDIETFIYKFSFMYILVSTLITTYLVLSRRRFNLEGILELSSSFNVPPSTLSDEVIPIIMLFLVAHVTAFTFLAKTVFVINYLFLASTNYTVIATKRIVSKSMKAVIDKMVRNDIRSPLEVLHSFRQVLTHNLSIENTYCVSVLIGLTGGVFMILISLTLYWKVYGLHKTCDCFESKHPFVTVVSQYYAMCQLLLLGLTSSQQQIYVSVR